MSNSSSKTAVRSLLVAGLLPVIAFTVIEEWYGTWWGLIAGMVFGVGEIIYERATRGRVEPITWGGNGLLLVLGGVSLVSSEGIWFKLQPAIIEAVVGLALVASVAMGKPLLLVLMRQMMAKQGMVTPENLRPILEKQLASMTFRVGLFFALNAGLAAWAAFYWSTAAWAFLKGIGFTVALIIYLVAENWLLRYRLSRASQPR